MRGGGEGFFVFTDKPAAEEYFAASGGKGHGLRIGMVPDQGKLADLIDILAWQGVTISSSTTGGAGRGQRGA